MFIRNSIKSKVFMQLGMASLLIFALLGTSFIHAKEFLGENLLDGARGMSIGLCIGFNLLSIVKKKQER